MLFRLENVGPLREAELDLSKPLIVLAGPNNTGKTSLAWNVYGLHLSALENNYADLFLPWARALLQSSDFQIDLSAHFARDRDQILATLAADYQARMHLCFAVERKRFDKARLSLRATESELGVRLEDKGASASFGGTQIRTEQLKLAAMMAKVSNEPNTKIETELAEEIAQIVIPALLGPCTIFPAERIAVNVFAREVALRRTRLADELVDAALEGKRQLSLEGIRSHIGNYPWPLRESIETANSLHKIRQLTSPHADLADELEKLVLGGTIKVSEEGELSFSPEDAPDQQLEPNLTASVVKSLSSLVLYFRHQAQGGELIIIDEPELNLHPDNQRKVARILAKAVGRGFRIMMSTHSDYMVRELNHLILLSKLPPDEVKTFGYEPECVLEPAQLGVYLFNEHTAQPIPVEDTGFSIKTIDDQINALNEDVQRLYARLFD